MQIINGQPTFNSSDVVFRNDGKFAYDGQDNVMGLWGGDAGQSAGAGLDTSVTSFLDYLKGANGAGLSGQTALGSGTGETVRQTLTGANANMWGNSQSNPYYDYMLQLLTGGKVDVANPNYRQPLSMPGQQSHYQPGTGARRQPLSAPGAVQPTFDASQYSVPSFDSTFF